MFLPQRPLRALKRAARALRGAEAPLLAQLVVTRRCNLSCGYCNEYDAGSDPVPVAELERRIDRLAELGTVTVTLTGGEPLLHPRLDALVARAAGRGMVCTAITNGYPVTRRWIDRLNGAGLSWIQISVDNLEPNATSQKSLSRLRGKLELLRAHARFGVNVNAVLGACPPEETRRLVREIEALGLYMTVGLMHDGRGQVEGGLLGDRLAALYTELQAHSAKTLFHLAGEGWEHALLRDGHAEWKCRAGGRYLYVDEHGRVAYCSQRRADPGIDLLDYGPAQLRHAFDQPKSCAPSCTLACVRRASAFDRFRAQRGALPDSLPDAARVSLPVLR